MFIDTHAHLDYELFDEDREAMIQRAWDSGVERIITIGTNLESSRRAIGLAKEHDKVFAVIGVHPTEAQGFRDDDLVVLREMVCNPKVVGIGEIGLDYYWKETPPEIQHRVFRQLIQFACEADLPIVIHNREASDDVIRIVQEEREKNKLNNLRGVMHCFSGDEKLLRESLELNFFISFAGNITYKKSLLPELLKKVPLDRILIETDAPFLTPVPFRGKRNEPAFIQHTAAKLSETLQSSVLEVGRLTSTNAQKIFHRLV